MQPHARKLLIEHRRREVSPVAFGRGLALEIGNSKPMFWYFAADLKEAVP